MAIECSPIELEIIFSGTKHGQFINFDKSDEKYFHIYVDNQEYKKNEIDNEIKEVKIIIDHQIKSFSKLFFNCKCIKSITFNKFHRTNIIDMKKMFDGWLLLLKELNLSNFNTVNVNDLSYKFNECKSLRKINLSNFNIDNVTDMSYMFSECKLLKKLIYLIWITKMWKIWVLCSIPVNH